MNIRRALVTIEGGQIFLTLDLGHATEPLTQRLEIDPATSLALAGQLESAVHRTATAGLELWSGDPALPPSAPRPDPVVVAAAAALPIPTDF